MEALDQRDLVGVEALTAATTLLQRIRSNHPTAGLWEAGDRQWSWRDERPTDDVPQLVWFDETGQPSAAALITQSPHGIAFDPILLPDTTPETLALVVARGLAHAVEYGFETVDVEVDRADDELRGVLFERGFTVTDDGVVEGWLAAEDRPAPSRLADGYRLSSRAETLDRPHHMISRARGHADPEPRLRQTSLYRPDLDLVVHDRDDEVAAYGLFWYDPVSATGLVEPMRTEEAHQQRGLARHVLTTGVERLVDAGARRIKIVYEPANPAASRLYPDVGFVPHRRTDLLSGPTS